MYGPFSKLFGLNAFCREDGHPFAIDSIFVLMATGSLNSTLLADFLSRDHLPCAGHVGTTLPLPPFAETLLQLCSQGADSAENSPTSFRQFKGQSWAKATERLTTVLYRGFCSSDCRWPMALLLFYVWCTRPAGDEAERIFPGCKVASTKMERRKGPLQVRPDATLSERAFWPRYGRCWIWISRRNSSFVPFKALLLA